MYDRLSGMSINQWTVPARLPSKPGSLDWSRIAPLKYQEPPGKQARPLVDMSIRVVAKNIGIVSKELLETIPPRVLWRLWRFLEARFVTQSHRRLQLLRAVLRIRRRQCRRFSIN